MNPVTRGSQGRPEIIEIPGVTGGTLIAVLTGNMLELSHRLGCRQNNSSSCSKQFIKSADFIKYVKSIYQFQSADKIKVTDEVK